MAPIVLAYWKIRGLVQPARMILGFNDVDFEDRMYEIGDAPDYDRSCWTSVKNSFGLDFPNLPYLIDGDVKLTQSNAILRYLGRKFDLIAETEEQSVRMDLIENQAMDLRNGFVRFCYGSDPSNFKEKSEAYKDSVKNVLGMFDKFLGITHKWFAGDKMTFVDFIMFELLDQHRLFDDKILESFDNLKSFMSNFGSLPKIKAFIESEKCFKGDINNKQAIFKWIEESDPDNCVCCKQERYMIKGT